MATSKSAAAYRTISEVSDELDLAPHVLRFWETKFTQVQPLKRAGNRRYYRPEDVELLQKIRRLLHDQGYTIKGVQKLLKSPPQLEAALRTAVAEGAQGQGLNAGVPIGAGPSIAIEMDSDDGVVLRLKRLRDELASMRRQLAGSRNGRSH